MAQIISVLNKKGGVGKTTTVINLAVRLAELGYKTLIIDADVSQANSTLQLLGEIWNGETPTPGLGSVIVEGRALKDVIYNTDKKNLFIIPSEKINQDRQSYNVEMALNSLGAKGYFAFKLLIEKSGLNDKVDIIIFDLPPSLGLTVSSALIASNFVLIPFRVDDFSKSAVMDTVEVIKDIKELYNPELEILGAFVSQNDRRNKTNEKMIEEARTLFSEAGSPTLKTMIPFYNKMTVLPRERKSIFDVKGAKAEVVESYRLLAEEILKKIKLKKKSSEQREVSI